MNKKFSLKNYSTDISAERSIAEIEKILASFGAEAIMKEYTKDGKARALSFKINGDVFKLPANVSGVKEILFSGRRGYYGRDSMKNREEKAYKVAWRILKDWTHAQLSLIASGQAHPQQLFFGHMCYGNKTLYQVYVEKKQLPQAKEETESKGEES